VQLQAKVVVGLEWSKLDPEANDRNGLRTSTADSKIISVWVIPNEELMIARHTAAMVREKVQ
jgi:acetate kinase